MNLSHDGVTTGVRVAPKTDAERMREYRARHGKRINSDRRLKRLAEAPVETVIHGTNAKLIHAVCRLHLRPADTIADLTYGKGTFWKAVGDGIRVRVTGSDLVTCPKSPHDFRALPYADKSFDVVVFDPPYIQTGNATHRYTERYGFAQVPKLTMADVVQLYADGMAEARRVARKMLWVKCKDGMESGRQCWLHLDVHTIAMRLGLTARDLFILAPRGGTTLNRWDSQHHARKVHSYLWVFAEGAAPKIPERRGNRSALWSC
jgi:hypothetical protein